MTTAATSSTRRTRAKFTAAVAVTADAEPHARVTLADGCGKAYASELAASERQAERHQAARQRGVEA